MSSWIHNLIILAAFLSAGRGLKTLLNSDGEQRISGFNNAALVLPNATELETTLGSLNILQELTALRSMVETLQNQTAQLEVQVQTLEAANATRGCAWEGLGCDCHLDAEDSRDAAVLTGSLCIDGILQWVRIIDAVHGDAIFFPCLQLVNATILATCDVMF